MASLCGWACAVEARASVGLPLHVKAMPCGVLQCLTISKHFHGGFYGLSCCKYLRLLHINLDLPLGLLPSQAFAQLPMWPGSIEVIK